MPGTEPIVAAPASFVPAYALNFGAAGDAAQAVTAVNPLPTWLVATAATSSVLAGTFAGNGLAGSFVPEPGRPIVVTLSGGWSGTATLLRSTDNGATRLPITLAGASWGSFTGNANEPVWTETELGATFFLSTQVTDGTLTYRVAQ